MPLASGRSCPVEVVTLRCADQGIYDSAVLSITHPARPQTREIRDVLTYLVGSTAVVTAFAVWAGWPAAPVLVALSVGGLAVNGRWRHRIALATATCWIAGMTGNVVMTFTRDGGTAGFPDVPWAWAEYAGVSAALLILAVASRRHSPPPPPDIAQRAVLLSLAVISGVAVLAGQLSGHLWR